MSSAREREPKTIRKELETKKQLHPAVQASNLFSFQYARPSDVAFDRFAGSGMGVLAKSLSEIDPALRYAYTKKLDNDIAEDLSTASLFKQENPELTKNMEAWKEEGLKDPRVLALSPWVQKYIGNEVLRGEGLQYEATLKNHIATSSLMNETDPRKFSEAIQHFNKQYLENSSIGKYEDKLSVAQNFSPLARAAEASAMEMHNRSVISQHTEKLEQQFANNFSLTMKNAGNITTDGYDANLPSERSSLSAIGVSELDRADQRLKDLGYPESKIMGLKTKMLLNSDLPVHVIEEIAHKSSANVNGESLPLIHQTGVAKAISKLKDDEESRAFTKWQHSITRRDEGRREALRKDMARGFQSPDSRTDPEYVINVLGVAPENYKTYVDAVTFSRQTQNMNPDKIVENQTTLALVRAGVLGRGELDDKVKDGHIGPDVAPNIYDTLMKVEEEEGKSMTDASKSLGAWWLSLAGQATVEEANAYMTGSKKPSTTNAMWAYGLLPSVINDFYTYVEDEKKKAEKKSIRAEDTTRLLQKFIGVNMKSRVDEAKERQVQAKTTTEEHKSLVKFSKENFAQPMRKAYDIDPAVKEKAFALHNFSLLFGVPIPEEDASRINTPLHVIEYANNNVPGGLQWQQTFILATGVTPSSVGVETVSQAFPYMEQFFTARGYKVTPRKGKLIPKEVK